MPNTSATGGYLLPTTPVPASDFNLDRRISNILAGISGIPGNLVRPAYQVEPALRPAENINWISFNKVRRNSQSGSPFIQHDSDANNGDGLDRLWAVGRIVYLVTVYGPDCEQYAQLLVDGLEILQNHEFAMFHGINLKEIGDQIYVPEKINEKFYRRVDVNLTFEHYYYREYNVLNILRAEGDVSGNFADSDHTVNVHFDTDLVQE